LLFLKIFIGVLVSHTVHRGMTACFAHVGGVRTWHGFGDVRAIAASAGVLAWEDVTATSTAVHFALVSVCNYREEVGGLYRIRFRLMLEYKDLGEEELMVEENLYMSN
jgi:hypothetical protein